MKRRVVVTGMGIVSPLGNKDETWTSVQNGKSAIKKLEFPYNISPYESVLKDGVKFPKIGGQCRNFVFCPTSLGIDSEKAKKLDRTAQFAVVAAHSAVIDAGYNIEMLKEEDSIKPIAVVVGSAYGGSETLHEQDEILFAHRFGIAEFVKKKLSMFLIPKVIASGDAAHPGIVLGATGPTHAIGAACASGAVAIGEALWMIRSGRADIAFAGGAEAGLTPAILAAYSQLGVYTSRQLDDPSYAMCPYNKWRDGFVASEGSGIVLLEEFEHAKKRSANIYGEVIGYGTNSDAFHITRPDAERLRQCIDLAVTDAKINLDQIDYINTHGTSTAIGDVNEVIAITKAFEKFLHKPPVSSTKSMLGHGIGSIGAIEFTISLLAMRDSIAPPTINLECPDPECSGLDFIPNIARKLAMNTVMSINYGFGGLNCCLIVKKI